MVYIFNQKQQKILEVLHSTYKQLAECMPDNEERREIFRTMYKETYLPLFKAASVKASVEHGTVMYDVVSFFYRGNFSKPYVDLWDKHWKVIATEKAIYFKSKDTGVQIKYALNTFDVDPATKQLPKWCLDLVRMVQAIGTKFSCVALVVTDKYNVLNSPFNYMYNYMTEEEFVTDFSMIHSLLGR